MSAFFPDISPSGTMYVSTYPMSELYATNFRVALYMFSVQILFHDLVFAILASISPISWTVFHSLFLLILVSFIVHFIHTAIPHHTYPRNSTVTFSDLPTPSYSFHDIHNTSNANNNTSTKGKRKSKKDKIDSPNSPSDVPSSVEVKKRTNKKANTNTSSASTSASHTAFDDDIDNSKSGRKRRKNSKYDDTDEAYTTQTNSQQSANSSQATNDASIIKRRRKGELNINIQDTLQQNYHALHSSTNANFTGLHSLAGGILTTMGPPDDTPRRSFRNKNQPSATNSSNHYNLGLNTLGMLQGFTPYGNTHVESPFNPDIFSVFIDTPSNSMHADMLSSKPNTGTQLCLFVFCRSFCFQTYVLLRNQHPRYSAVLFI